LPVIGRRSRRRRCGPSFLAQHQPRTLQQLLDAGIAVADAVLLAQLLVKVPHAEIKIFFRGTDSAPARLGHALGACRGLRFSTRTACQNVLCPLATRKITSSTFIARSRAHCG